MFEVGTMPLRAATSVATAWGVLYPPWELLSCFCKAQEDVKP